MVNGEGTYVTCMCHRGLNEAFSLIIFVAIRGLAAPYRLTIVPGAPTLIYRQTPFGLPRGITDVSHFNQGNR